MAKSNVAEITKVAFMPEQKKNKSIFNKFINENNSLYQTKNTTCIESPHF